MKNVRTILSVLFTYCILHLIRSLLCLSIPYHTLPRLVCICALSQSVNQSLQLSNLLLRLLTSRTFLSQGELGSVDLIADVSFASAVVSVLKVSDYIRHCSETSLGNKEDRLALVFESRCLPERYVSKRTPVVIEDNSRRRVMEVGVRRIGERERPEGDMPWHEVRGWVLAFSPLLGVVGSWERPPHSSVGSLFTSGNDAPPSQSSLLSSLYGDEAPPGH